MRIDIEVTVRWATNKNVSWKQGQTDFFEGFVMKCLDMMRDIMCSMGGTPHNALEPLSVGKNPTIGTILMHVCRDK